MADIGAMAVQISANPEGFVTGVASAQRAAGRLLEGLKDQIATFGMSANAAQLHRLRMQGVSETTLAAVAAHQKHLEVLKKQQAEMEKWQNATKGMKDFWGNLSGGNIAGAIGNIPSALMSAGKSLTMIHPAIQVGAAGLLTLAGAAAAAWHELRSLANEGFANIKAQLALAKQLSISTDAAAGLRSAANMMGVEQEALTNGFTHMQRVLGEAVQGSEEARGTFRRLGLDWVDLAATSPDVAFNRVNDALMRVSNANERAHDMQQIYGRGYRDMLGVIAGGSSLIEQQIQGAVRWGNVLSDIDRQSFSNMRAAWREASDTMSNAREGIVNRLALAFAPALEKLAQFITSSLEALQPVFEWLRGAIDWIGERIGTYLARFWEGLDRLWPVLERIGQAFVDHWNALSKIFGSTGDIDDSLEDWADILANVIVESAERFLMLMELVGPVIVEALTGIRNVMVLVIDAMNAALNAAQRFYSLASNLPGFLGGDAAEEALQTLTRIQESLDTFRNRLMGQGEDTGRAEARAWERAWREAYAENERLMTQAAERRRLLAAEEHRNAMAFLREQFSAAEQFFGRMQSPLEHFQEQLDSLNLWHGLGIINDDEMALGFQQITNELEKALGEGVHRFVSGMEYGSREAVSKIYEHQYGGGHENPAERAARLQEVANQLQQQQLNTARELLREVQRLREQPAPAVLQVGA